MKYNQNSLNSDTIFSEAPFGETEYSQMYSNFEILTTGNAGDLIPFHCQEILPGSIFEYNIDFVVRQETLKTPTMGQLTMFVDVFFVQNRVINESFDNVLGENTQNSFTATSVSLAPLWQQTQTDTRTSIQIPIGSIADYYGFPTQYPIPTELLAECHDMMFRGHAQIYNDYYRDQNYQKPIQYSKLNVYEGFLLPLDSLCVLGPDGTNNIYELKGSDGSYANGALEKAIYGEGGNPTDTNSLANTIQARKTSFSALSAPLKANKLHDYFTSVLPNSQKGDTVLLQFQGGSTVPVKFAFTDSTLPFETSPGGSDHLRFIMKDMTNSGDTNVRPFLNKQLLLGTFFDSQLPNVGSSIRGDFRPESSIGNTVTLSPSFGFTGMNIGGSADLSQAQGLGISIGDLRFSVALQQYYEALARGGSRYEEYLYHMFGLEINDKLQTRPIHLGRIMRKLDLFQTAQTTPASSSGDTPASNLTAFGYTSTSGKIPKFKAYEHGFVHMIACVRQKNLYPAYFNKSYTRRKSTDFYNKYFANINEQPVYTYEINPFVSLVNQNGDRRVFGYQEAWAEYRYDISKVSGQMRQGIVESLAYWTLQDKVDNTLLSAGDLWLKSNAEDVVNETLAVKSSLAHQFKFQFNITLDKTIPLPTHSVPGLDII